MNRMTAIGHAALLGLTVLSVGLASCQPSTWTADELRDWYALHADDSPHYGPLFYRGSDTEFHYFTIRAMDDWVFAKVKRGEIELRDERPLMVASDGPIPPSPGYYAVDPLDGFKKIETDDSDA